ncbi:hypothetical protein HDU85_006373 [Gaertneriomyces sp. JEL0708]|nr:hypothetical protein HDU85_006373 [Gaertneriomyces sp. JEL0708]
MGVPKFFRWISERYPLCSQLIQENRIPEFDNLYLDMNGIIHNCSHPNDGDVHFRMSEDQIFLSIFSYIDHLFGKIKPKKLFFLAVDGVAPRAKMNQQRARRFRTAKDTADATKRALQRGEQLPDEPAFDSNCITPGTPFMARLQEQLKYFINKKITEDAAWHGVEVILSGHEVPGEGEHKIMEYLRLAKSQPGYDPNVRHCLYGLDADLMMLGLLSHEPHFALLREEVTFGRSSKKASNKPDAITFYLMHLSLFREYLDAEFCTLKEDSSFDYDLERIIDDFILLAYFVGNDFLPNLPGLHINEGALALMFKIYKRILIETRGYLNSGGQIDLKRCEVFLKELGAHERQLFELEAGDMQWLKGKQGESVNDRPKSSKFFMTPSQRAAYDQIKFFVLNPKAGDRLLFSTNIPAKDKTFILKIVKQLGLSHQIDTIGDGSQLGQPQIVVERDEEDDEDDEESMEARKRVLKRWDKADVIDELQIAANLESDKQQAMEEAFLDWKKQYYKEKMDISYGSEDMSRLVYHYVEGLQWIANYYYNGVASWEWFYPYHYAPKITDLVGIANLNFKFEIGRPFLPFEQLMGVLPAASRSHIPEAFRDLMVNPGSPIIDFYPVDFELDMNGKKADWEAIVKIPFIDEKRLISALKARENQLTKEEKLRNTHGNSYAFTFNKDAPHVYPSAAPATFADIPQCLCEMRLYNLPILGSKGFVKGLCAGARLGVRALPGFPTMHTLPHSTTIGFHGVRVFNTESPNESVIVTIGNVYDGLKAEDIAKRVLGQRVHVGWPFLQEALVTQMVDEMFVYERREMAQRGDIVKTPVRPEDQDKFYKSIERLEGYYSKRYGIVMGPVEYLLSVRLLKGMKLLEDGALVKDFASFKDQTDVILQTVVERVDVEDPRYIEQPPPALSEAYPVGATVFFLGHQGYGSQAEVTGHAEERMHIRMAKHLNPEITDGLNVTREIALKSEKSEHYQPSWQIAKQLGISSLALAKVTSSLHVISKTQDERYNLGLSLKFEGKKKKVLGYSRKSGEGWEYSQKTVALIKEFQAAFPEFVAGLERRSQDTFYEDTEFYPPDIASTKMAEIKQWLKMKGVKDFEQVSLDTVALPKDVIQNIEATVDDVYQRAGELKFKKVLISNVPRPAVLLPSHGKHRLSNQQFDLGDRVVYTRDSGSVPIGLRGTVIAIEGPALDVVFDHTFMGGSSLGGRCAAHRGCSVNKDTVLNLSHQQPPLETVRPTEAIPINKPIPKFSMQAGGNALARNADRRPHQPANQGAPLNSWGQGPPAIMSRSGAQSAAQSAPQTKHRNGSRDTQTQSFSSGSGLTVQVTKRIASDGPTHDADVAQAMPQKQIQRNPTSKTAAQEGRRQAKGNVDGNRQFQDQRSQTSKDHAARTHMQHVRSTPAVSSTPPRGQNIQQPTGGPTGQDISTLTQNLKSMLHIGGNSPQHQQTHDNQSHNAVPMPGTYVPPTSQIHSESAQPSGLHPHHMHSYQPLPVLVHTTPSFAPNDHVHPTVPDQSNVDVSRQIMAMLQPQQANPSQVQHQSGFSPYTVAAAAASAPIEPVQNELVTLVRQMGGASGRGRRPRYHHGPYVGRSYPAQQESAPEHLQQGATEEGTVEKPPAENSVEEGGDHADRPFRGRGRGHYRGGHRGHPRGWHQQGHFRGNNNYHYRGRGGFERGGYRGRGQHRDDSANGV